MWWTCERVRPLRLPTVLTQAEVRILLAHLEGVNGLLARLLYGTGMRLMEGVRLRVATASRITALAAVRAGVRAVGCEDLFLGDAAELATRRALR